MSDVPQVVPTGDDDEQLLAVDVQTAGDGSADVMVAGEIDVHTAPLLVERIRSGLGEGTGPVRLDMAAVTFMDSSGLRSLISLWSEGAQQGRSFELAEASRPVRRVIQVTGLAEHFGLPEGDEPSASS